MSQSSDSFIYCESLRPRNMCVIRRNRLITFCMAAACLILGSAVYILFRPMTLLMFHWADALSLTHSVQLMRASVSGLEYLFPAWFVFSLPFALWVLSYLLLIEAVWMHSQSRVRIAWFWSIPFIVICAEFAQIKQIIPGNFDWKDMAAIIFAIILGFFITSIHNLKRGERKYEQEP